jgi:hypothetical protein
MALYFERRELRPYAQSILPSQLEIGHTYYHVSFVDPDLSTPVMEPLVFVGFKRNKKENVANFQDALSFYNKTRHRKATRELHVFPVTDLGSIFDFESALDELLACSVRRSKSRTGGAGGPHNRD